jgi:hypothetical protein
MPLTKVSFSVIQVANNVTSTTVGNTTSIPSFTFDQNGVITSASNVTPSIANTQITGTLTGSQISSNTLANSVFQTGSVENYLRGANLDFGMRNRIINGAMRIDQRNAGANTLPSNGQYQLDRWQTNMSVSSKFSVQQDSSANTVSGFVSSLKVTSTSAYSVGAGDYFTVTQPIEGFNTADLAFGTASAKNVTLSFSVRSSLTGTFGGALMNNDYDRSYPFTYTIVAANTWEYKTITIPGDTSGTWLTTNGTGLQVHFGLGSGSTYSGTAGAWVGSMKFTATGATSVVGTLGATWYVTGVQLEEGSVPTSFEYRQQGTELALCQRYYVKYSSSGAQNQAFLIGVVGGSTSAGICSTNFGTPMRASPTASYSGSSTLRIYDGSVVPAVTSIGGSSSSTTGAVDFIASGGGLTTGRAALIIPNGSPCYVDFSAEL